jgi:hypothetical protein
MIDEGEEGKRLKPIINACYPGTLTGLALAVLQVTGRENLVLRLPSITEELGFGLAQPQHLSWDLPEP